MVDRSSVPHRSGSLRGGVTASSFAIPREWSEEEYTEAQVDGREDEIAEIGIEFIKCSVPTIRPDPGNPYRDIEDYDLPHNFSSSIIRGRYTENGKEYLTLLTLPIDSGPRRAKNILAPEMRAMYYLNNLNYSQPIKIIFPMHVGRHWKYAEINLELNPSRDGYLLSGVTVDPLGGRIKHASGGVIDAGLKNITDSLIDILTTRDPAIAIRYGEPRFDLPAGVGPVQMGVDCGPCVRLAIKNRINGLPIERVFEGVRKLNPDGISFNYIGAALRKEHYLSFLARSAGGSEEALAIEEDLKVGGGIVRLEQDIRDVDDCGISDLNRPDAISVERFIRAKIMELSSKAPIDLRFIRSFSFESKMVCAKINSIVEMYDEEDKEAGFRAILQRLPLIRDAVDGVGAAPAGTAYRGGSAAASHAPSPYVSRGGAGAGAGAGDRGSAAASHAPSSYSHAPSSYVSHRGAGAGDRGSAAASHAPAPRDETSEIAPAPEGDTAPERKSPVVSFAHLAGKEGAVRESASTQVGAGSAQERLKEIIDARVRREAARVRSEEDKQKKTAQGISATNLADRGSRGK